MIRIAGRLVLRRAPGCRGIVDVVVDPFMDLQYGGYTLIPSIATGAHLIRDIAQELEAVCFSRRFRCASGRIRRPVPNRSPLATRSDPGCGHTAARSPATRNRPAPGPRVPGRPSAIAARRAADRGQDAGEVQIGGCLGEQGQRQRNSTERQVNALPFSDIPEREVRHARQPQCQQIIVLRARGLQDPVRKRCAKEPRSPGHALWRRTALRLTIRNDAACHPQPLTKFTKDRRPKAGRCAA